MNSKEAILTAVLILGISSSLTYGQEISQKAAEQISFAQGLLERGMYDLAVAEYQKFTAAYPQSSYCEQANLAIGESWFLAHDFSKSLDAFNQFRQLYPQSTKLPAAVLRLGQIYIEQKMYDQALKELTSVNEQSLKGQQLQSFDYYIGKAHRGKDEIPQAIVFFQKAADTPEASTYTPDALGELAELYVKNAQYNEAVETYAKALASTKDQDMKAYYNYKIGETQFVLGKYTEAVAQFRHILESSPNLPVAKDALTNLLLSYFNLGQYEALLKEYQSNAPSIKEDAAYFNIHNASAQAYMELNKFDEAEALLNKILSFKGLQDQDRQKVAVEQADILIRQKKYAGVFELLDTAADTDKKIYLEAQTYYKIGNFAQAIAKAEEYMKAYPAGFYAEQCALILGDLYVKDNQAAKGVELLKGYLARPDIKQKDAVYFLLGLNEQYWGQDDQALEAYGKVSSSSDDKFYLSALKNSAGIYMKQKKELEAALLYDRVMGGANKDTMDILTYLWVCGVYLKENKFDDLLRVADKAEHVFPGLRSQEIAYFKAEAFRGKGDCPSASKFYDTALADLSKNMYAAGAQIGKGLCEAGQNHFDEARQQFQKVLDDYADDPTLSLRSRFELANLANAQKDFTGALKLYLLVATIYEDEAYCPQSLFQAGLILESQNHAPEALKLYDEIMEKYPKSPLVSQAKEKAHVLREHKN